MSIDDSETQEFVYSMELFLNSNPENLYFKGNVISMLSSEYYLKAMEMLNEPAEMARLENKVIVHDIAKRIIDMNRDYPCQYRFYECMGNAAEVRASHVMGYLVATFYSNELIANGIETDASMILIPEEYALKFYPAGNYHYEDNDRTAAAYAPKIFLFAGSLEDSMARAAFQYSDFGEGVRHLCKATGWYKRVLEAGCRRIPDAETKGVCERNINRSIEQEAETKINLRVEFFDYYCGQF